MLARIAQELFWLGRDLTRAEHTARMLDGAFHADVAGAPSQRGSGAELGGRAGDHRRQAAGARVAGTAESRSRTESHRRHRRPRLAGAGSRSRGC